MKKKNAHISRVISLILALACTLGLTAQSALAVAEPESLEDRDSQAVESASGEAEANVSGASIANTLAELPREDMKPVENTSLVSESGPDEETVPASSGLTPSNSGDTVPEASGDYSQSAAQTSLEEAPNTSPSPFPDAVLTAEPVSEDGSQIRLKLEGVIHPAGKPVWFQVAPVENPEELRAYFGYLQPDGTYLGIMRPARHGYPGIYRATAYIGETAAASVEIELTGCTSASLEVQMTDNSNGAFQIRATAEAPSGVRQLTAAVWSSPDQRDLIWYDMEESDGVWNAQCSVAAHGHSFGPYWVHIYADLGNGLHTMTYGDTYTFTPSRHLYADRQAPGRYIITMMGTGLAPGTALRVPVWSTENGQDDLYWYAGTVEEDGAVRCPIDLSLHSASSPDFIVHLYYGNEFIGGAGFEANEVAKQSAAEFRLNRACRAVYDEAGYDLHSVYLWTVNNITYDPRPWQPYTPPGYTREQWYALEGFDTHKGDCFVYAAAFATLARGLGYDARYVEGYVWSVRGLWADHGFVVIHQDGMDYICDPELQSVAKTPRDLFMQPSNRTRAMYKW